MVDFDGFEARLGGGLEAVEEGKLGKQEIKIGAKRGIGCTSRIGLTLHR